MLVSVSRKKNRSFNKCILLILLFSFAREEKKSSREFLQLRSYVCFQWKTANFMEFVVPHSIVSFAGKKKNTMV